MGKTLVVAEKPSVARELANVLKVPTSRGTSWFENERYVMTWAIGHLVTIAEPENQDSRWSGPWNLRNLPMLPRRFALTVIRKTASQFQIVQSLLNDDRIDTVVNATDAGREGELIFRRIYVVSRCTKPIRRLWASDMTEEGLTKALARMTDGESKRNLGLAAFARAEADWLVGMNFSRLLTVTTKTLVTVGRVQTPVLKMLVDRRRAIEDFVSSEYWTIDGTLGEGTDTFDARWHAPPEHRETRVDDLTRAEAIVEDCRTGPAQVIRINEKKGRQKSPLPFDLTTLQREANKRHGLSARETLDAAQNLYERHKIITYPRTDSNHLTSEVFKEIARPLHAIREHFPDLTNQAVTRIHDGKSRFECVNDRKVTDHHAIIPTSRSIELSKLPERERIVYELVCRRFLASLLPQATFRAATLWIRIGDHLFKATGKVFEHRGWLAAEPWRAAQDNPLPRLENGMELRVVDMRTTVHTTKPPPHFTDSSLLGAMETAGKLVEDRALREAMKERGLGTPATRAQTIETLVSRNYVRKKGKTLIATDKGARAIDDITARIPSVASPELTGEWEHRLKEIEAGREDYLSFMAEIRNMITHGVEAVRSSNRESPGPCPLCKAPVVEQPRSFGCSRWQPRDGGCRFTVWKTMHGAEVNRATVEELLSRGHVTEPLTFSKRRGGSFRGWLVIAAGRVAISHADPTSLRDRKA